MFSSSSNLLHWDSDAFRRCFNWKGDFDCFLGLFFNNISTLLTLIAALQAPSVLGSEIVYNKIMPGIGFSMLFGNLYYSLMAYSRAVKTGRSQVTAQPYGINTPGAFAFVFSIIYPIVNSTNGTLADRANLAWKVGVAGNFLSGLILIVLAPLGDFIRRNTPKVALFSSLAGVGFTYLLVGELLDGMAAPQLAFLPLILVLWSYWGNVIPFGRFPPALAALVIGSSLSWLTGRSNFQALSSSVSEVHSHSPSFVVQEIFSSFGEISPYLSIIVPVSLTVALGTIQCVESAAFADEEYSMTLSMLGDGIGTLIASLFGSPFGMTIYIGLPAFKKMNGRVGYSLVNGILFFILSLSGLASPLFSLIEITSVEPVIIFVGFTLVIDTFQMSPPRFYPAIIMGILPSLCQWADTSLIAGINTAYTTAYSEMFQTWQSTGVFNVTNINHLSPPLGPIPFSPIIESSIAGFQYSGLHRFGAGGLTTGVLLSAIVMKLIDHKFVSASIWSFIAMLFSLIGIIHTDQISWPTNVTGQRMEYTWGYFSLGLAFAVLAFAQKYWPNGSIPQPCEEAEVLEDAAEENWEKRGNIQESKQSLKEPLLLISTSKP